MHGVMLKHHGHDVLILEQTPRDLEAQAAGVAVGPQVKDFLDLHDRLKSPFSFPCKGIKSIDSSNNVMSRTPLVMKMTSWEAVYFHLRANFDGTASRFCTDPPPNDPGDGEAVYEVAKKLVSINEDQDGRIVVQYEDIRDGTVTSSIADLVIGADGASSSVRSLMCPSAPQRQYAGYVLWRGIVPENELSRQTLDQTSDWFSFYVIPKSSALAILYPIPGKNGSLQEGERGINFAWYTHLTEDELNHALTDINGHKHRWSVPMGKLDPGIWTKQLAKAEQTLNPACLETAKQIKDPFIQVIGDRAPPPRATFHNGKVLLVGDALTLLRPHAGSGIGQGALHALWLEQALSSTTKSTTGKGVGMSMSTSYEERIRDWEAKVLEFGHVERLKSISWGEYWLGGWSGWVPAAAHYHGVVLWKTWRARVMEFVGL